MSDLDSDDSDVEVHPPRSAVLEDREDRNNPSLVASLPPDTDPPEGPAFVVISRVDGTSIRPCNPFKLNREMRRLCRPEVKWAKPLKSGSLLVHTIDADQSRVVLGLTSLLGKPVKAKLADRLTSSQGAVHALDLAGMSVQGILDDLSDQGVVEVQRFRSRQDNPNPLLRLRFRGSQLPDRIICGYLSLKVKPWVDMPRQCKKCWKIGHLERTCRARISTCGNCAASNSHHTSDCDDVPRCPNCTGPHAASDRKACPLWDAAIKAAKRNAIQKNPRPPPSPSQAQDVWPALPAPSTAPSSPLVAPSPTRPSAALVSTDTQTEPLEALVHTLTQTEHSTGTQHTQTDNTTPLSAVTSTQTDTPPPPPEVTTTDSQTNSIQAASHYTQTDTPPPPPEYISTASQSDSTSTAQSSVQTEPDGAEQDTPSRTPGTQTDESFTDLSSVSDADSSVASDTTIRSTSSTSTQTGMPSTAPERIRRFALYDNKGPWKDTFVVVNGTKMLLRHVPLLLRPGTDQWRNVTTATYATVWGKQLHLVEEGHSKRPPYPYTYRR